MDEVQRVHKKNKMNGIYMTCELSTFQHALKVSIHRLFTQAYLFLACILESFTGSG